MPTRLPRALPVPPVARRAGACMQRTVRRMRRETLGRLGVLRPWTMRRLPAALNPTSWPVSGLTNTPLRLPGCTASSGGRPHAAGMRRSGAASCRARRVRLPLRGQHRLARLRCRQAPCFPFNCARRSGTREHQNACECRRRCGERQDAACRQARFPLTGAHGPKPCAALRPGDRCAIVCAAFGARMRNPRMQLNGKQEADHRPACAVPATVRRPRDALPRARAQAAHDATALQPGGKAAAWQAASPDTGRRKGRARRSPNARSAGDG
ncbi:hypothetical protein BCO18430_04038 [Burkholderia contaminans]|nr:hypothetical protein BCO18430_04038 [Burkholderia contaminans]